MGSGLCHCDRLPRPYQSTVELDPSLSRPPSRSRPTWPTTTHPPLSGSASASAVTDVVRASAVSSAADALSSGDWALMRGHSRGRARG